MLKNVQSYIKTGIKKVARTGIEPATQGFSVFLSHFQPILLMVLNHPNLPKSIGKTRFFPGNTDN
jgi:hypothetical protein